MRRLKSRKHVNIHASRLITPTNSYYQVIAIVYYGYVWSLMETYDFSFTPSITKYSPSHWINWRREITIYLPFPFCKLGALLLFQFYVSLIAYPIIIHLHSFPINDSLGLSVAQSWEEIFQKQQNHDWANKI